MATKKAELTEDEIKIIKRQLNELAGRYVYNSREHKTLIPFFITGSYSGYKKYPIKVETYDYEKTKNGLKKSKLVCEFDYKTIKREIDRGFLRRAEDVKNTATKKRTDKKTAPKKTMKKFSGKSLELKF